LEGLLIFPNRYELGDGSIHAGLAHFKRIDDRQRCLLLERVYPAIPELRLVVEGIQNGRCVAFANAAFDADRSKRACDR
jgi:hypothetical protein